MKGVWQNNRISYTFSTTYKFDYTFSTCDIDGVIRKEYNLDGVDYVRFIIYESKNNKESLGSQQLRSLKMLNDSIDWSKFDDKSGMYIFRIMDNNRKGENKYGVDKDTKIQWLNLDLKVVRTTTMQELYEITTAKEIVPFRESTPEELAEIEAFWNSPSNN